MNLGVFFFTLLFLVYPYFATKDPPESEAQKFFKITIVKEASEAKVEDKTLYIPSSIFNDVGVAKQYLALFKTFQNLFKELNLFFFPSMVNLDNLVSLRITSSHFTEIFSKAFEFQTALYFLHNQLKNPKTASNFETHKFECYSDKINSDEDLKNPKFITCMLMADKLRDMLEFIYSSSLNSNTNGIAIRNTDKEIKQEDYLLFIQCSSRRLVKVTFRSNIPNVILAQEHNTLIIPSEIYTYEGVMSEFRAYYDAFYRDNKMNYFIMNYVNKQLLKRKNGGHIRVLRWLIPCLISLDKAFKEKIFSNLDGVLNCDSKMFFNSDAPAVIGRNPQIKKEKELVWKYANALDRAYSNLLPWLYIMEWLCSKKKLTEKRNPIYLNKEVFKVMKAEYSKMSKKNSNKATSPKSQKRRKAQSEDMKSNIDNSVSDTMVNLELVDSSNPTKTEFLRSNAEMEAAHALLSLVNVTPIEQSTEVKMLTDNKRARLNNTDI